MRALIGLAALIAVLAATIHTVMARRTRAGWREMRPGLLADVQRGGLHGLQRAHLLALRLSVAEPDDDEISGVLAYAGARLATSHGLPFEHQADAVALRAERAGRAGPLVAAARALVSLRRGERARALEQATAAASGATTVEPYLALAQARAWSGDSLGASRTLEAARMLAPEAGEPQVAWAAARLDLGDAVGVLDALERALRAGPDDTETRLLLAEALDGAGKPQTPAHAAALAAGCARDEASSPLLRASCALERAARARHGGDRAMALREARRAEAAGATHPRLLGRLAQVLAQLGQVDDADALIASASKLGAPEIPALAWARVAVSLGRGQVALPPASLAPTEATTRLIAARAALAAGGARGLERWLASAPPDGDPELHLLRSFVTPAPAHALGPMADYLAGVRARLDGELPAAARHLEGALQGHADACRAAGEWMATLVALGRPVDVALLAPLRATNSRCVNLDPAALTVPVPPRKTRR